MRLQISFTRVIPVYPEGVEWVRLILFWLLVIEVQRIAREKRRKRNAIDTLAYIITWKLQ